MKINPCSKCGSTPRVKYQLPYNWVQCKCGNCSRAIPDYYEQHDLDSINDAISDWNSKNKVAK